MLEVAKAPVLPSVSSLNPADGWRFNYPDYVVAQLRWGVTLTGQVESGKQMFKCWEVLA